MEQLEQAPEVKIGMYFFKFAPYGNRIYKIEIVRETPKFWVGSDSEKYYKEVEKIGVSSPAYRLRLLGGYGSLRFPTEKLEKQYAEQELQMRVKSALENIGLYINKLTPEQAELIIAISPTLNSK